MKYTRLVTMEMNVSFLPNPLVSQRWCSGQQTTRMNPKGTPVGATLQKSAGKNGYMYSRSTHIQAHQEAVEWNLTHPLFRQFRVFLSDTLRHSSACPLRTMCIEWLFVTNKYWSSWSRPLHILYQYLVAQGKWILSLFLHSMLGWECGLCHALPPR